MQSQITRLIFAAKWRGWITPRQDLAVTAVSARSGCDRKSEARAIEPSERPAFPRKARRACLSKVSVCSSIAEFMAISIYTPLRRVDPQSCCAAQRKPRPEGAERGREAFLFPFQDDSLW